MVYWVSTDGENFQAAENKWLRVRRPLLEDAWGVVRHAVAVTKQLLHGQSAVRGTRARQYVMKRWQQWVVAEQTRRSRDEEAREDEFLAGRKND